MYIRRIKGPHSVTLPDGSIMTRADLPDPTDPALGRQPQGRRGARRRSRPDHRNRGAGDLGPVGEELAAWREAVVRHGVAALRATALQRYRGSQGGAVEKIGKFFLFRR
jgi:hypothetical protein